MASFLSSINIVKNLRSRVRSVPPSINPANKSNESIPLSEDELLRLENRNKTAFAVSTDLSLSKKDANVKNSLTEDLSISKKKSFNASMLDLFIKKYSTKLTEHFIFNKDVQVTEDNQYEYIRDCTIPLYKLPYQKQIFLKKSYCKALLQKIHKNIPGANCSLEYVLPSFDVIKYRNKDEFSVNVGCDGNPKTVGFNIISSIDKKLTCVPPTHLIHIKDSHKLVAKHFQEFIRNSRHKTCLSFHTGGVWRNITVRSSTLEDLMAIITVFSKGLLEEELEDLKMSLSDYFSKGAGAECNLTSLYLCATAHSRSSREESPYHLLFGKSFIQEELLGRQFLIGPDTFFHINISVAETLFTRVMDLAEMTRSSTLLDISCGTGVANIIASPNVRGSIAIGEKSDIDIAKLNAVNNNVKNTYFISGDIVKSLSFIANKISASADCVAVINGTNKGFSTEFMYALRECSSIRRIVFISCKPEHRIFSNFVHLSMPYSKNHCIKTQPFVLRHTIPFDLFPHSFYLGFIFFFVRDFS